MALKQGHIWGSRSQNSGLLVCRGHFVRIDWAGGGSGLDSLSSLSVRFCFKGIFCSLPLGSF